MHFMMNPDMVYQYPIWAVGLLLITITVAGAVFLELCVRRILPAGLRRQHNEVTAALFLIIGVTYAVLLAFVAMLAWENFNRAKAASYAEAAAILDVYNAAIGFTDPKTSLMRSDIIGYAREVVNVEWPAQAQGRTVDEVSAYLERLNNAAVALDPSSLAAGNLHAMLLQALMRLQDARQDNSLPRRRQFPISSGSFCSSAGLSRSPSAHCAPNLWMQLSMSAALSLSGAMVLILIIALSNPFRGDFRITTQPFTHVSPK